MPRLGGLAGRARENGAPSYWDLPGSGITPGGQFLYGSPRQGTRTPTFVPSIDLPYPMGGVSDVGGGIGGTYNTPGTGEPPLFGGNWPPWENVSPYQGPTFYRNTPDWVGRATDTDAFGNPIRGGNYPDLSNAPPVTVEPPNWPRAVAANPSYYPLPGGGGPVTIPSNSPGGWIRNASRSGSLGSGYGSGRFAGPMVSFGYGGTMIGSTSGSLFGGNPMHGIVQYT